MIEILKNENSNRKRDYLLLVDGDIIDAGTVYISLVSTANNDKFTILTRDHETSERIAAHSLNEMSQITELTLTYNFNWCPSINSIEVTQENWIDNEETTTNVGWSLNFKYDNLSDWRGTYSFAEYFKQLDRVIESKQSRNIRTWCLDYAPWYAPNSYFVSLRHVSPEIPLSTEILRLSGTLKQLHDETESALSASREGNIVAMSFEFPDEVRVPCEQYLLYFGKFLQDLGVQATSDLQHNAGRVLFTVTPADSQTALDKIRAALDIYLQLPSSPVSDSTHAEIAIQRLEANVLRVKSDLKLAAAELQAKNMTIEAQQLIIETQKGLLSGEIVFNSMKDVTPKPEDKEELLGGIIALATYKDKGVEVNLAELYRKLKALFKDRE